MWCLLVVTLKGFHLGWLCSPGPAVCNLFSTPMCAWGHRNLLERSWHSATHSFRLSAQGLRHSSLTSVTKGGALAGPSEKQNKTAEPKCEAVSLCWRPQRLQISLKSLLQKCVLPQQFRDHGLLWHLQTTLRPARCHMIVRHQKCRNRPEKERFGGHLFASQKLAVLPPDLNRLVYIGFPMCFITSQLVLTESQNALPSWGRKTTKPKSRQHSVSHCCH